MGHHHDDEMEDDDERGGSNPLGFMAGVLLGGLIGIGVGIVIAPASGEDTRQKLRDQAISVRDEAKQRADEARDKAKELEASSREMLEAQKRRVQRTAEAVKQSAQEAWTAEEGQQPTSAAPVTTGHSGGALTGGALSSTTSGVTGSTGPRTPRS